MDMKKWLADVTAGEKKPLPVLSYPAVQELGITVGELASSSEKQVAGMKLIADRYDMPASVTYMDLSIEAEAFGANCVYGDSEVPTITGKLIGTEEEAEALRVPEIGAGRTGVAVETVEKAVALITDRPVLAGCIGPFSLTGRLMNVNDVMVSCYTEPELVHAVLQKAEAFITSYILALKAAGADGVIMAEPLAGILSPDLMQEFSSEYVARIVKAVEDDSFLVVYHNCGSAINQLVPEVLATGCRAYHFGESADMPAMLAAIPGDCLVMGNISPSSVFNNSTPDKMREAVAALRASCAGHANFVLSSGCDIPPRTSFEMIDAFFEAAK